MSGSKGIVGRPDRGALAGRPIFSATPGAGPGDFDGDSLSSIPSDFTPWPGGPRELKYPHVIPRVRTVSKGSSSNKSKKTDSTKKSHSSSKQSTTKKKIIKKKSVRPKPRKVAEKAKSKIGKGSRSPKKTSPKASPASSKASTKTSRSTASPAGPKPSPIRDSLSPAGSHSSNKSRPSTCLNPTKQIVQMLIQTQTRLLHRDPTKVIALQHSKDQSRPSSAGRDPTRVQSPGNSKEHVRTHSATKSQNKEHTKGSAKSHTKSHNAEQHTRKEHTKSQSAGKVKLQNNKRKKDQVKEKRRSVSAGQVKEKQRGSPSTAIKERIEEKRGPHQNTTSNVKRVLDEPKESDSSVNSRQTGPSHLFSRNPTDSSEANESTSKQRKSTPPPRQQTRKIPAKKSNRLAGSSTSPQPAQRESTAT